MKIYINQGEAGDLKCWIRREGEFFTFLHGVNIAQVQGRLEVSPVYTALARWERHTQQAVLIIGYRFPLLMIALQKRWPFVQVVVLKEDPQ